MHKIVVRTPDGVHTTKSVKGQDGIYDAIKQGVGGWLEHTELVINGEKIDIWLDEEGKLKDLPVNMFIPGDVLVGTLVFTGGADMYGNTMGLNDAQLAALADMERRFLMF